MDQEAAQVSRGRSIRTLGLPYGHMLSDGESAAYKAVCDLNPYHPQQINKLECISHAHKCMGTALRKRRGVGRLTKNKCDNNVDNMRKAIWAGLYH